MSLSIVSVSKAFANKDVLHDESMHVPTGSIMAVVGPSGSGKTTLLRIVAGLEPADRGRIEIDGDNVTDWPTHRRHVGLVFQDNQLFPHLDVAENIAFGLRSSGASRAHIGSRVGELLAAVGLSDHASRSISTLSGGEAKRVALARTLAPMPRVVLLDEPFAGLDDERRSDLAPTVRRMLRDSRATALLVSHDRSDVTAAADGVHHIGAGESVSIVSVPVESVRPLRREVLRAGMVDQSVTFDGDDDSTTFHLAAFDTSGRMVATSTWMRRDRPGSSDRVSYQLRGMATASDWQSRGLGARLIADGLQRLEAHGATHVWANARDAALDFYRRQRFDVEGDRFIEPVTNLPHHVVVRPVTVTS